MVAPAIGPPLQAALTPSIRGPAISGLADQVPPNIPVLGGALQVAGAVAGMPTVTDQMQVPIDLAQKYGTSDSSQYSPEDREKLNQSLMAVGSMASPLAVEGGALKALQPVAQEGANALERIRPPGTLPALERTPIGEGGLGTPNYDFPEGSPEQVLTQVLRNSAAADDTGRARLTSEQMSQLPGLPSPDAGGSTAKEPWNLGTPPALDDWRSAIDAGIQHAQWYSHFAQGIANTVGRANIPEFAALFGITSPQAKVDVNLSQTLALMRMAREFEANGTPFTEQTIQNWIKQTDDNGVQINGILKNDGTPGGWPSWTGFKAKQVAQLYNQGKVEVPSNAKTPSYSQNVISALHNLFDPNSTIDTWMFRLGGYLNNGQAASEDLAYRAMRTINGHLAGELGITPNQAQAAAWFGMKAVKDFADTAGAPKALKQAIASYAQPGSTTTLGDLVAMGKNEGGQFGNYPNLFDSPAGTWEDTINNPKIAHQLGMLPDNIAETSPPGSASAGVLTYPGKTTRAVPSSFPVTPEDTTARRRLAEGQAPVVGVPQEALGVLGYNPETNQFAALNTIPHVVDHQPNATNVLIPGGNIDAAQYVGAVVNKAAGADHMDVHMFAPEGNSTVGYRVINSDGSELEGAQAQAIRDVLDKHDLSYSTSPDGTIVRLHTPLGDEQGDFENRVATALGQMSNVALRDMKGVAQRVGADEFDSIVQRFGNRFGAEGQPSLQARGVDIGGQEAAQGQGQIGQGAAEAAGAAQAGPPAVTGGAQAGAINPQFGTALGGAAAGGLAGYNSDPDAPPEQRVVRAAAGALAGAGLGYAAARVASSGISPWDVIQSERIGSLAGGIPTIAHIALNAPLQAAWKVLSDAPLTLKSPETIPMEFVGAWRGASAWLPRIIPELTRQGPLAQQAGGGVGGQALEAGLLGLVKTHPVLQDLARQIGTHMELYRLAGEEAAQSGLRRFSAPWWNEVERLVQAPTADMATSAQRAGDTFALRGPMGTLGSKLGEFLQDNPIGRFINPFFNIGYHVSTAGIERSPLGILGTGFDVARAAAGRGPYAATQPRGQLPLPGVSRFNWEGTDTVTGLGQRVRNNALGVGAAFWAYSQAAQGNITGEGPEDPRIRQELQATGWQPDSIRISGRYFPLHVLGPLGWPLSEAANLYEATHTGDQGGYAKPDESMQERFGSYAQRLGSYFQNETFLRGIGDLTSALQSGSDAERNAAYQLSSYAGSLIPQGALLANVASAADPMQRKLEPGNIAQSLENRLPGLREQLPEKLSPTGLPMPNPQAGAGILLPRSSVQTEDRVANMLLNVGMSPPPAPKTVRAGNQQIELTPDEQYHYQVLRGGLLQQMMLPLTNNERFLAAPPQARKAQLEKIMTQADSIASRLVLGMAAQGGDFRTRLAPTAAQQPPQQFVRSYRPSHPLVRRALRVL